MTAETVGVPSPVMRRVRQEKGVALQIAGPTFARHETFAPRFGWLKKGFDAVTRDPNAFAREDAALVLGVGKNMARSIRYWAVACGLLEDNKSAKPRTLLRPTEFGQRLLGTEGWDPYLEDLSSLWLLHWRLLRPDGIATTWSYVFSEFSSSEFSADDLTGALEEMVKRRFPSARAAVSSLRKDAVCLIQMYAGGMRNVVGSEESIRSPFAELDLIGPGITSRHVSFRIGSKPGLSSTIIAALCLDFMGVHRVMSMPFSTLLRSHGSPGLALRLSEAVLYEALEQAVRQYPVLRLSDTAGIIQLSSTASPTQLFGALIDAHYVDALRGSAVR